MKLIKIIASTLLAIIILWVIVAFFSPKNIGVRESILIEQSANSIFNQVNELKNWTNWSEWNRRDSNMSNHFSSPSLGERASVKWTSEIESNGSQEIVESIPYEKIRIKVLIDGWDEHFMTWEFTENEEFETLVNWTFEESEINFFLRPLGFSINNSIRKDYQKGLENLKEYSENQPLQNKKLRPQVFEADPIYYIGKHIISDQNEIRNEMIAAHRELRDLCLRNNYSVKGMPLSINYIIEKENIELELALQVDTLFDVPDGFISGKTTGGEAVKVSHFGTYKNIYASLRLLEDWIKKNRLVKEGNSYGIYVNDRRHEPDSSKWETQLIYLVKHQN